MKKIYFDPEMEIIELKTSSMILVGSTGDVEGGSDDGEVSGGTGGGVKPGETGWGGDY